MFRFCSIRKHLNSFIEKKDFLARKSFAGKVLKEAVGGSSSSHQSSDLLGSRGKNKQPDFATKNKLTFLLFNQIYYVPPLILNTLVLEEN